MVNDTVADLLARIQNGYIAKKESVLVPITKMTTSMLKIIKKEGFITDYFEVDGSYEVTLSYVDGEVGVNKATRISKPGRRVYVTSKEIKPVMNGRGISIISTSRGLMSGALAKSLKLGGELMCEIW